IAGPNSKECSSATARSKLAWTAGLHVVSKCTLPSVSDPCWCWAVALIQIASAAMAAPLIRVMSVIYSSSLQSPQPKLGDLGLFGRRHAQLGCGIVRQPGVEQIEDLGRGLPGRAADEGIPAPPLVVGIRRRQRVKDVIRCAADASLLRFGQMMRCGKSVAQVLAIADTRMLRERLLPVVRLQGEPLTPRRLIERLVVAEWPQRDHPLDPGGRSAAGAQQRTRFVYARRVNPPR